VKKTLHPIIVNKNPVDLHLSLVNLPQIIYALWADEHRTVKSFNWDIQAWKGDVRHNPFSNSDVLPDFYPNFSPVQLIISQEILQVALWTAFQTNAIQLEVSNKDLPEDAPINLNTTDLRVLFPYLADDFGDNKGVYLNITKSGDYPVAQIRDGRIVTKISLNLEFHVDTNSSQYPDQGLVNCTNSTDCKKAIHLNVTAFISLVVYSVDQKHIGLQIINVYLPEIAVIKGRVDGKKLQYSLNNLLISMVQQANQQLRGGIEIPELATKRGVNSTNIMIDVDRLVIGLDFTTAKKLAIEY